MVLDTSAIITLLTKEPEYRRLAEVIDADGRRLLSALNYYEALLVMRTKKPESGVLLLDEFVTSMHVEVVPFGKVDATSAYTTYSRHGRGFSPARLNLGDCAAYALAVQTGEPLLFKGGDFALTGIPAVKY